MPKVTLYTKPGCHLCDDVLEVIELVRSRRSFNLLIRNILDDVEDYAKYKHAIPVVMVNGQEIGRYRLTESELASALDRATI